MTAPGVRGILYVANTWACQAALQMVGADVVVQNAMTTRPRPPWLRGVPTLVLMPDYAILEGSAALRELEAWVAATPPPADADEFVGAAPVDEDPQEDGRYLEAPPKLTPDSLEALLQQRGASAGPP